jgi:hypothetical protein
MNSLPPDHREQQARSDERVERLITAVERMERRLNEFFGAYLNAKFPYGKPTDRWRRSA